MQSEGAHHGSAETCEAACAAGCAPAAIAGATGNFNRRKPLCGVDFGRVLGCAESARSTTARCKLASYDLGTVLIINRWPGKTV